MPPDDRAVDPPPLASLKALGNPVRLRLFYAVGALGEATATMLAPEMHMAPTLVSYHLKELGRFGLLEQIADPSRDQRERWWRIREGGIQVEEGGPEAAAFGQAVMRHHVWQLNKFLDGAAADIDAILAGFTSDMVIRLDQEAMQAFQRDLAALLRRYARAGAHSSAPQLLVMVQGIPVVREPDDKADDAD